MTVSSVEDQAGRMSWEVQAALEGRAQARAAPRSRDFHDGRCKLLNFLKHLCASG